MTLRNFNTESILHFLALGGIFTSGIVFEFLPVSISQFCILLLFVVLVALRRIYLHRGLFLALIYALFVTVINIDKVEGINIVTYIRTCIYIIAYYSYVSYLGRDKLPDVYKKYITGCYIFSIIAIVQEIGFLLHIPILYDVSYIDGVPRNIVTTMGLLQVYSLTLEPVFFVGLILPCMSQIIQNLFIKDEFLVSISRKQKIVISIAFLLTFSFTAYVCLLLIFSYYYLKQLNFNFRSVFYSILIVAFVVSIFFVIPGNMKNKFESLFAEREALTTSVENLSAFAIISNFLIAKDAANDHYLGTGFFTNKNNFDAYINDHFKITNDTIILNRLDGGSMYIKILSEYGYIGLFLFFLLFYLNRSKRMDSAYSLLNNCLFITILVLFLRTADYVSPILTYIIVVFFFTANDRLATSEEPVPVES